jgi:hypothetical protein
MIKLRTKKVKSQEKKKEEKENITGNYCKT